MFTSLKLLFNEIFNDFLKPTTQQKETLSRFLHALLVASLVGAVVIFFASNFTWYSALRFFITSVGGVAFFSAGLVINRAA